MNKDEILMQRKDKFLSIGRSKGFTSYSVFSDNLSMKPSLLNKIKNKLDNNKKYIILLIGIFVLALVTYLL